MSTIDQQFVEYIVKSLVENGDDVIVDRIVDEKGVLLTLTVNPEDLGRVIGRRGVTAQSLRTLLKIVNNDNPEESTVLSSDDDVAVDDVDNSTDETVENESSKGSEFAKKSRAELAELDDLDI